VPDDTKLTEVLERAMEHHRKGELTPAEQGYRRVLQKNPEQPDALHLLGIILYQLGDSTAAIKSIRHSLAVEPSQPRAWNNLGNVYAAVERWEDAVQSYGQAIALKTDYAEAHHNLAHVLAELGRADEAIAGYRSAIALKPEDASSHVSLASLFATLDRPESAIVEYRAGLDRDPRSIPAHAGLGSVLRKLERLDEARAVYDDWLTFDPDSPIAEHLRATCAREDAPERASDEYVRAAFDGIAYQFDEVLGRLDYRVPDLIAEAMEGYVGREARGELDILDLGCGTGLCARRLKSHARWLMGVDLSPNMLAQAREKNVYDELVEEELTRFLQRCTSDYDVIVSGDTLVYMGDLGPVFPAVARALRAGGTLLFTLEAGCDDRYRLNVSGRYVHSPSYVRHALTEAGLQLIGLEEAVLREEGGRSVPGMVVAARRIDD
jgi:predicted TPR repeat methyltransferase